MTTVWEPVEGTSRCIIYYYPIVANNGHYDGEPRGYVTYSLHCIYPSPDDPREIYLCIHSYAAHIHYTSVVHRYILYVKLKLN